MSDYRRVTILFLLLSIIEGGCGVDSSTENLDGPSLSSNIARVSEERPMAQNPILEEKSAFDRRSERAERPFPEQDQIDPSKGRAQESSNEPNNGRSAVAVRNGRLNLSVQNRSLASVLDEISRQSGVTIHDIEKAGSEGVTIQIKEMPIDQGLQQILSAYDLFFFYQAAGKEGDTAGNPASSLKGVWFYPKGEGGKISPIPPEQSAGSAEIKNGLRHPDPAERGRAVELLVAQKGERALDEVRLALNDREDPVRERALDAALHSGMILPQVLLEDLARNDPSPIVRLLALGAVAGTSDDSPAGNSNVKTIAQWALNDPDPFVKEQARQILDQLDPPPPPPTAEREQWREGGEIGAGNENADLFIDPAGTGESIGQEPPSIMEVP